MKNTALVILIALISLPLFSQDIREVEKTISMGAQPAFVINHPNATAKMAEAAWEEHMKKNGKAKKNRKSKEYETLDANINMISSTSLNVYYIAEDGVDMATSYIFFDNGSNFITSTSDADAASGIYEFLTPYVYGVEKLVIEEELDKEEKGLKDLGKDLEKLAKTNEGFHKDIEKYKEKIREAEIAIEKNLQEQDAKNGEITNQESVIKEVKKKLNAVGKN